MRADVISHAECTGPLLGENEADNELALPEDFTFGFRVIIMHDYSWRPRCFRSRVLLCRVVSSSQPSSH